MDFQLRETKRGAAKLVFPDGVYYNLGKQVFRTEKVNSVFALFASLARLSEEDDVKNFIFHFVNKYNYPGTQKLFQKFGKDIYPKTNIETTRNA